MTTLSPRALVVGDRFIRADLFAAALAEAAELAGLPLTIEQLQLDYPAVDAVPLPAVAAAPALGRSLGCHGTGRCRFCG